MQVYELWASWEAESLHPFCFWCEDQLASGSLTLVYADSNKPVSYRTRPTVCGYCAWDCHDRIVDLPGNLHGRWIYVAFKC